MAWRYLRGAEGSSEGRRFLRFITYVAVGGVAVGVAALLLALAIVRGFSQEIEEKIIGFGAHIQVQSYLDAQRLTDADTLARKLRATPGVAHVSPVVEHFVLLRASRQSIDGVALFGSDAPPSYLAQNTVAGTFSFARDSLRRPGLVVGQQLASRLGVEVGSVVTAFALGGTNGGIVGGVRPRVKQFHIAGIYETSLTTIDDLYVFGDLTTARDLFDVAPGAVSHLSVTVDDVDKVSEIAAQIESDLGFPVAAQTIYQRFQGLFAWVNLQQNIIPVVISVIVVVAAFNIIGALLMMILEKTREIGVLESMGASARTMRRLFLMLGVLIGLAGTALGETIALGLALLQQHYKLIPLPAEAYFMKTAPVALNPFDFILVGVVALVLCALAAYLPARVASRVEPVAAIRFR